MREIRMSANIRSMVLECKVHSASILNRAMAVSRKHRPPLSCDLAPRNDIVPFSFFQAFLPAYSYKRIGGMLQPVAADRRCATLCFSSDGDHGAPCGQGYILDAVVLRQIWLTRSSGEIRKADAFFPNSLLRKASTR